MADRGNLFSQDYSIGDSSETSFPERPTPEETFTEYLYLVENEVVDDLRRITKAYAKNIGGLSIVSVLPRREYQKKYRPQLEDSLLVEDLRKITRAYAKKIGELPIIPVLPRR